MISRDQTALFSVRKIKIKLYFIDIDPGEDVTFADVKEAAFEIRDQLMESNELKTVGTNHFIIHWFLGSTADRR